MDSHIGVKKLDKPVKVSWWLPSVWGAPVLLAGSGGYLQMELVHLCKYKARTTVIWGGEGKQIVCLPGDSRRPATAHEAHLTLNLSRV